MKKLFKQRNAKSNEEEFIYKYELSEELKNNSIVLSFALSIIIIGIFSIFYNTPFIIFGTEKSSSRMKTLLSNLDLPQQHLLPTNFKGDTDQEPFTSTLDYDKLDALRNTSQTFLAKALN